MKILIHYTTSEKEKNYFECNYSINEGDKIALYAEFSKFIDDEIASLNYTFIVVISYYDTNINKRTQKYYQLSRYENTIMVNKLRIELKELFYSFITRDILKENRDSCFATINIDN